MNTYFVPSRFTNSAGSSLTRRVLLLMVLATRLCLRMASEFNERCELSATVEEIDRAREKKGRRGRRENITRKDCVRRECRGVG